jgi:archaemetzincin
VSRKATEASSNGRTADFGSAHEGSNPSASATPASASQKAVNQRAEVRSQPRPSRVLLVGLGAVTPRLLAEAGQAVKDALGIAPRAGPSLDRPEYAFNKERGQYHTPAILRRLASLGGADRAPVVGVASVDLFLPDARFVIGDADRDAGAAVYSMFRLGSPDAALVSRRAQVEAVHATGHLIGLAHCTDYRCAMFLSEDASDSDRKGPGLCASCRAALGLG